MHNVRFVVTHAPAEQHFGTTPVWKKDKKVLVSDPAKTVADMVSNPWTGAGIQHVADCVRQFFKTEHFDIDRLVDYVDRLGNRAVYKRLGFLAAEYSARIIPSSVFARRGLAKAMPSSIRPIRANGW